jgi:hypothetical protein
MDAGQIIILTLAVLDKLLPLAQRIYAAVMDARQPQVTKDNSREKLQFEAAKLGITIGTTEAELLLSAVHYAEAKAVRHLERES